jgi:transketolase
MTDTGELEALAKQVRLDVLRMIRAAGSGHPGGSFSTVEILVELYWRTLSVRPDDPSWPGRDRFVLSKGHACPALYSVLARKGYFDTSLLPTLRRFGSPLQGHPNMKKLPGLDASTGSLGQGLSIAAGMTLAARLRNAGWRAWCLLGDGELQEGSVWEAAMTAGHYGLDRLTAIVDRNGVQLDGDTSEVMSLEPLVDKWLAFGWDVVVCEGHSFVSLRRAFEHCLSTPFPSVVIANTVKGKGVSWMENSCLWHGRCPDEEEYASALRELEGESDG